MKGRYSLAPLVLGFFCVVQLAAGEARASTSLVTRAIDDRELVTLGGNTRPEVTAGNDRGAVPDTLQLEHLQLQLQRSPEQEQEVEAYIATLHDRTSPNFQRWLSSDEFGARFGTSPADVEAIEGWLAQHGLKVNALFPSRMVIDFSGSAGQVAAAFHTQIHRLDVNGAAHFANVRDPQVPAALAAVVAGIVKLNDFRPARKHRRQPKFTGDCGQGSTCYLMAPADLATIYDFNPLFHGAHPITGKGQTIAVAEDTDLYSDSDWTNFRHISDSTATARVRSTPCIRRGPRAVRAARIRMSIRMAMTSRQLSMPSGRAPPHRTPPSWWSRATIPIPSTASSRRSSTSWTAPRRIPPSSA